MMKAIGFKKSYPIEHEESFIAFETEIPTPTAHDLLVKVEATSINPVDYKIRLNSSKELLDTPKIIGWDAVGIVESVGDKVTLFKKGDKVFYAGDFKKSGTNAQYQLVDERITGHAPKTISNEKIAAMPLTSLTAWEVLFDRMLLSKEKDSGKSILIIGGAGGVGSIAIQLAKQLLGLKVIATASREETKSLCLKYGADYVVNHYKLVESMKDIGFREVNFILDLVDTNAYWDSMVDLIKPQGRIASITGSDKPFQLNQLKTKSVTFSWEFMFTRSMYQTEDMTEQHLLLNEIANLLDKKVITSTAEKVFKGFSVENFKKAHQFLETNKALGKTVILY